MQVLHNTPSASEGSKINSYDELLAMEEDHWGWHIKQVLLLFIRAYELVKVKKRLG